MTGEELLRQYEIENLKQGIYKIRDNIYTFTGYGYVNASIIIGETSVILVDCVCTMGRGRQLKKEIEKITDKPVRTIIYTRYATYDTGGAAVFRDTVEEVIGFKDRQFNLSHKEKLEDIANMYLVYCRGYGLNDEESMEKSKAFRNVSVYEGVETEFMEPTTLYEEDHVERTIDGIRLIMDYTPGMTNDHDFIYLPDEKVGFIGINYFNCCPSQFQLGARQYTDLTIWIRSLDTVLSYDVEALIPGKSLPVIGAEEVRQSVLNLRNGLEFLLSGTLELMNDGYTADEIIEKLKLPKELDTPEMRNFYGHRDWYIRDIYAAYLGWFDGRASHLLPVPLKAFEAEIYDLIGEQKLRARIQELKEQEEYQMALQLSEILGDDKVKKELLNLRARQVENVMARHFMIHRAHEL